MKSERQKARAATRALERQNFMQRDDADSLPLGALPSNRQLQVRHGRSAKNQRAKILSLLVGARGGWVPLPEIARCAAQYNARVFELRRLGLRIENRTEAVEGVRHSWFRIRLDNRPQAKPAAVTTPTQSRFPFEARHKDE